MTVCVCMRQSRDESTEGSDGTQGSKGDEEKITETVNSKTSKSHLSGSHSLRVTGSESSLISSSTTVHY